MNDTAAAPKPLQYSKFVWRRLEEPLSIGNWELPSNVWVFLLIGILSVALFYVVWMYVKDSKGIGIGWATLLGFLRLCVYAILAWVFLLPSTQQYNETTSQAKILVAIDVSDSVQTSDDLPTGKSNEKLRSRIDHVVNFLTDPKVNLIANLEQKNPVTAHRFGTKLDVEYLHFADGKVWTRDEREKPEKDAEGNVKVPERKPLPDDYWRAYLTPRGAFKDGIGLDENETKRLEKLSIANTKAVKEGLTRGTNIGEPMLALINKELNSRVQGLIVITDGRNTEGSQSVFAELQTRAKAARIPIFVVGIGEDRLKVKIDIAELRVPQAIQPDDKFRAVADLTGEGLSGGKLDVTLEIVHVRTFKEKVKGKDGKVVEVEKEEILPIEIIEVENENAPKDAKRIKVSLGNKIDLKPATEVVLDKSNPPRAEVEWQLDAVSLAAAAKIDLTGGDYKGKKWELAETKEDSELKFRVRVPTDPREGLGTKKFHESDRSPLKVIKKPVRVLIIAAAANRDYQFVRTLLVRESEKKRLELAIYLQLPPGEIKRRPGVVQDIPPERLLSTFPDTFGKKKGDLYDLSSYDTIVAYDPDWKQLTIDQIANLKKWADAGGGFIFVGGYINTVELIRPQEGADAERYKPILDMLPVVLEDRRSYEHADRKTDDPFDLDFKEATAEMEFLRLDEELDESKFKEDWSAFFFGTGKDRTDKPQRGFFNFYPVLKSKPGSLVVARYKDPTVKLKDNTLHPYIVMNPDQLSRVIWIGSAETWRLREYREEFHERFWTKLVRYAAGKSKGGFSQSIRPEMANIHTVNKPITVEARIDGPDGGPLDRNVKPEIKLVMPPGISEKEIKQPIIMTPRPGARDGWFAGSFVARSPGEYEMTIKVPKQPGQDSEQTATQKFLVKDANPELDNTRPDYARMYRIASEADEVLDRMQDADRNELKRRLQRPKPVAAEAEDKEDRMEMRDGKLRLYFDRSNAHLIPTCMIKDVQTQTSLDKVEDMWDKKVPLPLGFWLFVASMLIGLIAGIWLAVIAFSENVLWGLGVFFVPLVGLVFTIMHWGKAKGAFFLQVFSWVLQVAGMILLFVFPDIGLPIAWVLCVVVLLLSAEWLTRKLLRLA